ncbi:uncharacterized protein LOC113343979 [Papaver somniferum]|uniref:uncharacterized protein LOC113343979 n=1 Tax=Papaver somniferum TaxID=3469 RepID=UPI000E6FBBD2|nr:uncharacterized protein LOC113343979 [Papaver somniferum]
MNRGFFIIKLLTQEDKEKVYREGNKDTWIVNEHPLRLIEWYPGFDADKQCTSHSTVWVKFPGLPVEMWVEKTLLALGKTLGTPIVVDKRTLNHEYGDYASVLIDIDFAKLNTDSAYVEAECRKKHVTAFNTPPATVSTSQQSNTLVIHQGDANSAWKVAGHKKNGIKSLSTVALSTKPVGSVELARTRLPNPGRIHVSSLSTPVCDALEESSEYISHNKFNILGAVGEPLNNPLLEINKVDEVVKRAKQQQVLALQAKIDTLRDNDSLSDSEESELGIRARKGSSPRLKYSLHTSHQVKIFKTQPPKV